MKYWLISIIILLFITMQLYAGTWKDDFNDGDLNGWITSKTIWQGPIIADAGVWRVEDGMVIVGDGAGNVTHSIGVSDGWSWSDYTVEVSVKVSNPLQNWQIVGLFISPEFGVTSGLNIRDILGDVFAEGFTYTHAFALMNHISPKPFKMEPNVWYRMKIKVEDKVDDKIGIIQCFIDDKPIVQFEGYRKGSPGVLVHQTIAMFDDFVVTGPDIPDRVIGSKAIHPLHSLMTTWARIKERE